MFNIFLQLFYSLKNSTLEETRTRILNKFYSYISQGVAHLFSLKIEKTCNSLCPFPVVCPLSASVADKEGE